MFTNEAELLAEREAEVARERAVKEAQERAEQEKRDLAYREQHEQARIVRAAHRTKLLTPIAAAITRKGSKAELEDGQLKVDGIDCGNLVDDKQEYSKGYGRFGMGSKPTGRISLVVGDYGNRTRYPQRKDGTYNYDAIADFLIGHASRRLAANRMAANQRDNTAVANELRIELGLDTYDPVKISASAMDADSGKPVYVKYEIGASMSVEQAKKLVAAIREAGLKASYKDNSAATRWA